MYNAMESGGGQEHFMELQASVFDDEIHKEGVTDVMGFITEHAPLFRFFATHLPDDLKESWDKADTNTHETQKLESQYERFYTEVRESLSEMDPDVRTALTEAAEEGDIDTASRILEAHLSRTTRTEE
jgi:oligoendopeptidase F